MGSDVLAAKLKAFALMLKYGHDLFEAENFDDAAALAVNNSRLLLNFRTATLLEIDRGKARVVAQYGQSQVNPHSQLAVRQCIFAESLRFTDALHIVGRESGLPRDLAEHDAVYLCVKPRPPANLGETDFYFVWLLEYEKEVPAYAPNTAKLLASSVADALYYQKLCGSRLGRVRRRVGRKWIWGAVLAVLVGAMFMRVHEEVTAEFMLKAPSISGAYAWYDGLISRCLVQDGEPVKRGDVIAEYDTEQLAYRLSGAESALREVEAELALEERNAFADETRLGQVKLLEARRDTAKIAVEEARWYADHSKITAPASGILALTDGRAEQLSGRAVRTGDKLFEVLGGEGMVAEIPVDERSASILSGRFSVTLFLHTAPESAIAAEILEVSHYPELTEQKTYCYKVRVKLRDAPPDLRYGMRGVARLSGGRVSLGYRLFKNIVLYFRGL